MSKLKVSNVCLECQYNQQAVELGGRGRGEKKKDSMKDDRAAMPRHYVTGMRTAAASSTYPTRLKGSHQDKCDVFTVSCHLNEHST